MGSLRSRCPPTPTRERNGHCLSDLSDRVRRMFSQSSCPGDENDSRVMKQLVPSIECEPLKQGESDGTCEMVYTNIPEPPYNNFSWPSKGVIIAVLMTVLCFGLNYVMWCTNAYENSILKLVSIRGDIDAVFESWRKPPSKPRLSVYLFNYTNPKAIIDGIELPHVQEVGPYVFSEQMERIKVNFNDNDTVSFQEKRTINFLPEESVGSLNDTIRMPNVLLITLLKMANEYYFAEQTVLTILIEKIQGDPFPLVTVNESIWGFEDEFFKKFNLFVGILDQNKKLDQFGFLAKRRGIHHDIVTMNTGADDLNKVGIITQWNGANKIEAWGNTSCAEIEGSDGTMFPAKAAQEEKPLYVYSNAMCRRIPIVFNKTTSSKDGFPAQQYDVSESMFDYSHKENQCFKYKGNYPPNGAFNSAPCHKDAPMYASFPHFWKGGEEIKSHVQGLNPNAERHKSYFLIHKDLGISLLAKTRFQLNIKLQKSSFMAYTKKILKEKLILPIAWLDYDSGELPEHFVNVIYHLTYTTKTVQAVLQWTLLMWLIISIAMISRWIYNRYGLSNRLR